MECTRMNRNTVQDAYAERKAERERMRELRSWCAFEVRYYARRLWAASVAWLFAREVPR